MNENALQRRQRTWDKQDKLERDAAISALMQHRHGRRYIYWLLEISRAMGSQPFANHALQTAFNCGEMNIGLQIMAHLQEVDAAGFLTMMREMGDERAERTRISDDIQRDAAATDYAYDERPTGEPATD